MSTPPPLLVSVEEAARLLGCHRSHVYVLAGRGQIRLRKLGGKTVIALRDLEALVDQLETAAITPPPKSGK